MTREAFLARVRDAAQRGRAYRVHLEESSSDAGYVGARNADLCAAMAAEVNEVGGTAHLAADIDAAREQLLDLLDQCNAKSVLLWRHELLERIGLKSILIDARIEVWDYDRLSKMAEADARAAYMAAGVGVTSCDVAVAETGSLVVYSRPGQERIASLVPPVHIAVIERRQIVPDLYDAPWRTPPGVRAWRMSPDVREVNSGTSGEVPHVGTSGEAPHEAPSNISIITGPSKTGDIELTLTTGVHGPGKWHVIIIK